MIHLLSFSTLSLIVGAVSLLAGLLYSVLLLRFIKGWTKGVADKEAFASDCPVLSNPSVSIVVVCRNEAHQLPALIDALKAQTFAAFELIWVDDHSTDATKQLMQSTISEMVDVKVLESQGNGKKQGLLTGVLVAGGEMILVTDADCQPSPAWVETMYEAYCRSSADVLIGPVRIDSQTQTSVSHLIGSVRIDSKTQMSVFQKHANNWFVELQQLEFATLVASGMAGAALERAFMANGANMAFKKSVWLQLYTQLQLQQMSGDDVFLIHAVKQQQGLIRAVFDRDAMVTTQAAATVVAFFRQRRRWMSKAPAYRDKDILFTQWVVAGINLWMLILAVALPFNSVLIGFLLPLGFAKFVLDMVFIRRFSAFFGLKPGAFTVVLLFIAYPFYVLFTALTLVKSPKYW